MIAGDISPWWPMRSTAIAALWRPLAAYNGIDDPMRIANGTQILLPAAEALLA